MAGIFCYNRSEEGGMRMRAWRTQAAAALVSVLVSSVAYAAADIPDDWRQTAYSIAAGQIGAVNAYRIEDDLIWRRIDDSRFAAFKGMQRPTDASDWSVSFSTAATYFPAMAARRCPRITAPCSWATKRGACGIGAAARCGRGCFTCQGLRTRI